MLYKFTLIIYFCLAIGCAMKKDSKVVLISKIVYRTKLLSKEDTLFIRGPFEVISIRNDSVNNIYDIHLLFPESKDKLSGVVIKELGKEFVNVDSIYHGFTPVGLLQYDEKIDSFFATISFDGIPYSKKNFKKYFGRANYILVNFQD